MLQLYGDNLLCQVYKQWCGDHANPAHISQYDGNNQRIVDTTHDILHKTHQIYLNI